MQEFQSRVSVNMIMKSTEVQNPWPIVLIFQCMCTETTTTVTLAARVCQGLMRNPTASDKTPLTAIIIMSIYESRLVQNRVTPQTDLKSHLTY